jgi:hypothetical protein
MRKVHEFLNRGAGRDHADIHLLLSRKSHPSDNAGTQADKESIDAGVGTGRDVGARRELWPLGVAVQLRSPPVPRRGRREQRSAAAA